MSSSFDSPDFKALKKFWDKKLAKSGFVDIEIEKGDFVYLAQNAPNVYKQQPQVAREARLAYFSAMSRGYAAKPPRKKLDRMVMELYVNGTRVDEIVRVLKAGGIVKYKTTLQFIIRRYEKAWGVHEWAPEELKRRVVKKEDSG